MVLWLLSNIKYKERVGPGSIPDLFTSKVWMISRLYIYGKYGTGYIQSGLGGRTARFAIVVAKYNLLLPE